MKILDMEKLAKATIIEGVASTEHPDSQGETLNLEGADITPLLEGRGFVNSDHSGRFEHLIGRVLEAKKIQDLKDCETPSQVKYWTDLKKPFLWSKLELWDGHGHKEADAAASIYNFFRNKNEEAPIKLSVEGKTLERGANGHLKRTLIKGIALTVHPANRATRTEVVQMVKSMGASEALIKSETEAVPVFIEEKELTPAEKLLDLVVEANALIKSMADETKSSEQPLLRCQIALERLRKLTNGK